jgi:hypothetical protein
METTRVDICYRPLRIAWAIHSGDGEAFRDAVRFTHTPWGGRFNPIVVVDRGEEAEGIVELFRADVIIPVGESAEAKEFPKRFPHLITPFFADTSKEMREATSAHVLDVHNALAHWRDTPEWKANITSILAARRTNSAHLRRPWRATSIQNWERQNPPFSRLQRRRAYPGVRSSIP